MEGSDIDQLLHILDADGDKLISYLLFMKILGNSQNIEELLKNYYQNKTV